MRILLIEDDLMLGEALSIALTRHKYTVDWLTRGEQGLAALKMESFAAVVLDLTLPDIDGIKVLKTIRRRGDSTPVLILTARNGLDDRIRGLDDGADDYVTKPFELDEVLARMRALMRRRAGIADDSFNLGDVHISMSNQKVAVGKEDIKLTPNEYKILAYLANHIGQVKSKEQILQMLSGWGETPSLNTVEVHIHNLRKKMPNQFIQNIRGVGYLIEKKASS